MRKKQSMIIIVKNYFFTFSDASINEDEMKVSYARNVAIDNKVVRRRLGKGRRN
jgi:hypothetical protein